MNKEGKPCSRWHINIRISAGGFFLFFPSITLGKRTHASNKTHMCEWYPIEVGECSERMKRPANPSCKKVGKHGSQGLLFQLNIGFSMVLIGWLRCEAWKTVQRKVINHWKQWRARLYTWSVTLLPCFQSKWLLLEHRPRWGARVPPSACHVHPRRAQA